MKIAISGATGFIGQRLHQYLLLRGDSVIRISREMVTAPSQVALQRAIDRVDVVVNLAGESIDQRWTPATKLRIIESRTRTTRAIVAAINAAQMPKLLISASAVGIYSNRGCHNDYSRLRGRTFLADLCNAWESEARRLDPHNSLAIIRLGIVLAPTGGALPKLIFPSHLGFMPRIGSLSRHISWIDREDLVRAICFIIEREDLRGTINLVAPELTTQRMFNHATGAKITIPIPEALLRLTHGEAAEMILQESCTIPKRLIAAGFEFQSPSIEEFFVNLKK